MGRRPQERNASRCCGNTSRTITCKTQKTSNTFSSTKRWARSSETKESVPLVWLSFWEPTYHQSKEPVKTEKVQQYLNHQCHTINLSNSSLQISIQKKENISRCLIMMLNLICLNFNGTF